MARFDFGSAEVGIDSGIGSDMLRWKQAEVEKVDELESRSADSRRVCTLCSLYEVRMTLSCTARKDLPAKANGQ